MAALTAAVLACAGSGDRVVLPSDGYYTTRLLAAEELERFGIEVTYVADAGDRGVRRGRRAGRRPARPARDAQQPAARRLRHRGRARAARAAGALVAVDNTTATPLGQRPLALGAHMTVGSDTKALTGHSDLLLGHVSVTDDELFARAQGLPRPDRQHPGAVRGVAGPPVDEHPRPPAGPSGGERGRGGRAARAHRRRSPASGGRGGRRTRPSRSRPGRCCAPTAWCPPSWPTRPRWRGCCRRPGCGLAATSFGGVHSTIDRRAQWGGDAVAPGFVRFSCGIEDTADLVADLSAALAALG